MDQLIIGFLLATAVAFSSWKLHSLSSSGAIGATIVGTIIFGLGGLEWAVVLLTFFISSSLLSKLFSRRKAGLNEKFVKGSQRDFNQVLANSGIGSLFVIIHLLIPGEIWPWVGFVAAMASVNADTWATELGVLSPTSPRLITTWKHVEKGTSGAISLAGTMASMAGSILVGLAAIVVRPGFEPLTILLITAISGLFGSLVDSLLGATIQAIYYCPNCEKDTERHPNHTCGNETQLIRGSRWLSNDLVNAGCSFAGSGFALIMLWVLT